MDQLEKRPEEIDDDLELNDACSVSFEVPLYAAFHFTPDRLLRFGQKKRAFEGGLRRLAILLKNKRDGKKLKNGKEIDPRLSGIKYVSVTSWIVAKNAKILADKGFRPDFGSEESDREKLLAAYRARMRRLKFPEKEGAAMRMEVQDFIDSQLSDA